MEWLNKIASRWQREWEEKRLYETDPRPGSPKYFVTAAFPYPNSPTHIGNARSFLLADIIARFMRASGYNVLYPMGFHYTGTPILTMSEAIAKNDEDLINMFIELYEVPRDVIPRMKDPLELARYFHTVSRESMKRLGLGIDWRREFTTIDPLFQSFIRWQFTRLYEKGYVTRGTYPVGWCPVHQMPVGGHDTKDDKDPEIGEFTVILFRDESGRVFPTATLRPETIFAVTNIWVNPHARYVEARVDGSRVWVLSEKAYEKLRFQRESIERLRDLYGRDLEGVLVENPVTGERIPVVAADFVDPGFGTGVVMSVPSHSPDDYVAYREAMEDPQRRRLLETSPSPRKIIEVEGVRDMPARWAVERHGVKSSRDRELLERATRELYALEYSSGVMSRGLSGYVIQDGSLRRFIEESIEGAPVSIARERIREFMKSSGRADTIYELMNAPVYCRCGTEIVVKILRDQWFLKYSDREWKRLGEQALDRMSIQPEEMREYMRQLIRGLREKPCARTRGLGTPLPWDSSWVIESLSDSTIYMVFYTVVHRVRELGIDPSSIGEEFWDYVFLGRGDPRKMADRLGVDPREIERLREEFLYWYPLDLRVAGKDLANNHLLFFIMNHVALFPESLWPRAILVHGWVLREGEKMSKSKKNITPLFRAIEDWGADTVRAVLSISSEIDQDLDFRSSFAEEMAVYLKRLYETARVLFSKRVSDTAREPEVATVSRIARRLLRADEALKRMRVREAGIAILYEVPGYIQRLLSREEIWRGLYEVAREWVKYLSIYVPHIAEEIWRGVLGENSYVVREVIDRERLRQYVNAGEELVEEYITSLSEDLREITGLVRGRPREVVLYVAPPDDYALLREALGYIESKRGLRDFIENVLERIPRESRREAVDRLRRIYESALRMSYEMKELLTLVESFDEREALVRSLDRIRELTGTENIVILRSDDPGAPDYMGKKRQALPLRPAIYVVT